MAWPTSLPAPLCNGYGIEPEDQTIRTQMETGAARVRRRTSADISMVKVMWTFTDEQMGIFRDWFRDSATGAAGGAAWFSVLLRMGEGGSSSVDARFNGPWKAQMQSRRLWQVSAQLEVRG